MTQYEDPGEGIFRRGRRTVDGLGRRKASYDTNTVLYCTENMSESVKRVEWKGGLKPG